MTPEKKIQNNIINYLKLLKTNKYPIFFERRNSGAYNYKKGIPDIYCVYNGIHIEIEVKAENGKLSTMQEKFKKMCNTNNIIYICCNNIDDLRHFFETKLLN